VHFRNHTAHEQNANVKIITSCCLGEAIPLEKLSNDAFSSLILGDGFGVVPNENHFYSPVSGIVKDVSKNNCEVTIKTDDGLILIVSVGLNFSNKWLETECLVSPKENITQGQLIWTIDVEECRRQGNAVSAAVVLTNSDVIPSFNIRYGNIKLLSQPVMTITV
jgi:phosphotransferase system IIA component